MIRRLLIHLSLEWRELFARSDAQAGDVDTVIRAARAERLRLELEVRSQR